MVSFWIHSTAGPTGLWPINWIWLNWCKCRKTTTLMDSNNNSRNIRRRRLPSMSNTLNTPLAMVSWWKTFQTSLAPNLLLWLTITWPNPCHAPLPSGRLPSNKSCERHPIEKESWTWMWWPAKAASLPPTPQRLPPLLRSLRPWPAAAVIWTRTTSKTIPTVPNFRRISGTARISTQLELLDSSKGNCRSNWNATLVIISATMKIIHPSTSPPPPPLPPSTTPASSIRLLPMASKDEGRPAKDPAFPANSRPFTCPSKRAKIFVPCLPNGFPPPWPKRSPSALRIRWQVHWMTSMISSKSATNLRSPSWSLTCATSDPTAVLWSNSSTNRWHCWVHWRRRLWSSRRPSFEKV